MYRSEKLKTAPTTKEFYENLDRDNVYTVETDPCRHPFYRQLIGFIEKWNLRDKKCLEVGSSKGLFQDLVNDYTGADIAETLACYYHKKFIPVHGSKLPFPAESFDAVFTYATHEHIPDLEVALTEIIRVLRLGGVCLFAPAWHTRPWFAQGYEVRSYKDLSLKGKIIKLTIPFRDSVLIRWPLVFLRRLSGVFIYFLSCGRPKPLRYRKLRANYEKYWQSDSDACNSLDPFDVILWFKSRGVICHRYNNLLRALFVRAYTLELQKS
jgi:SAM-dependent methyltransferase